MFMTLFDYINMYRFDENTSLCEVTVFDDEYDIEVYFYLQSIDDDAWDKAMVEISKKLNVVGFCKRGVIVNLSSLIRRNLDNGVFDKLFIHNDVDSIMCDIENIFSGNVSEEWLIEFAKSLDIPKPPKPIKELIREM